VDFGRAGEFCDERDVRRLESVDQALCCGAFDGIAGRKFARADLAKRTGRAKFSTSAERRSGAELSIRTELTNCNPPQGRADFRRRERRKHAGQRAGQTRKTGREFDQG